jgi:hypothetical protein
MWGVPMGLDRRHAGQLADCRLGKLLQLVKPRRLFDRVVLHTQNGSVGVVPSLGLLREFDESFGALFLKYNQVADRVYVAGRDVDLAIPAQRVLLSRATLSATPQHKVCDGGAHAPLWHVKQHTQRERRREAPLGFVPAIAQSRVE